MLLQNVQYIGFEESVQFQSLMPVYPFLRFWKFYKFALMNMQYGEQIVDEGEFI